MRVCTVDNVDLGRLGIRERERKGRGKGEEGEEEGEMHKAAGADVFTGELFGSRLVQAR